MEQETKLNLLLKEVIRLASDPISRNTEKDLWMKMHSLAEARYQPAMEFFLAGLDDNNWRLRETSLSLLGFHYEFSHDGEIIGKIREMLLNDPEANVRITAASILGLRSKWPEDTLIKSFSVDDNIFVKEASFLSILELIGVPKSEVMKESKKLSDKEYQPSMIELERVISKYGFSFK